MKKTTLLLTIAAAAVLSGCASPHVVEETNILEETNMSDRDCCERFGRSFDIASGRLDRLRAAMLKAINAAIKGKDYAGAISLFTVLIDSDSDSHGFAALNFQNRGVLHVKLEQFEEAAKDFATALSMRDQLSDNEANAVHYNYVHALRRIGDYPKLEQEVRQRLEDAEASSEKFPHRRIYMRLLGSGLANQGYHGKAAEVYEQIIDDYPDDLDSYALLSDSARALENFGDAIAALSRGLEVEPKSIKMHERLLAIYRQLGNTDQARQELKIINDLRKE